MSLPEDDLERPGLPTEDEARRLTRKVVDILIDGGYPELEVKGNRIVLAAIANAVIHGWEAGYEEGSTSDRRIRQWQ